MLHYFHPTRMKTALPGLRMLCKQVMFRHNASIWFRVVLPPTWALRLQTMTFPLETLLMWLQHNFLH